MEQYLSFHTNAAPDEQQVVLCPHFRITVITSRLLRIEAGEYTDKATLSVLCRNWEHTPYTVTYEEDRLTLCTEHLNLTCRYTNVLEEAKLQISLISPPHTVWRWRETSSQNLGGTVSTLDAVDGACPLEDGVCSRDGYAVIDDGSTSLFTQDGWFEKRACNVTDVYFFGYGYDYTACVKDYYRLTGIPPMVPKFVLGNWWSRYYPYSDNEYLKLMDRFRKADVPLSVAVIDMDWHLTDGDGRDYHKDGWTGYSWNKALFPDYRAFLKGLHERGLSASLNLHPALGVRPWEDMYEEMAIAVGQNPALKKTVPFDCLDPDFLKAYFEVLHFPYEENGVDFWWMDWQQGTDYNWIHKHNGGAENELECITPLWILNHFHYLASRRKGNRGLIFSRFSGHGSQRYPIGFSGDTCITWDTLDFQPYFTATASNIGYGWWSHDIGGHYKGYRDDELMARWVQFGVFSPIFRLHSSRNIFSGREPWQYNKRAELVIEECMRLRHQLFPYLYTMCHRNTTELIPLMQPMYHLYPEHEEAYRHKNEYFFGSELLVAPITKKADPRSDRGETTVWFPQGLWIDWYSGYVYSGDCCQTIYRPLETMPVFLKAGAIVPMQPHRSQENALGLSNVVELVVAAGASNCFTLYEDDGITEQYKDGAYCTTKYELSWAEKQAELSIFAAQGDITLLEQLRDYTIVFKGFRRGCRFSQNGIALKAEYDGNTNSYTVCLHALSVTEKTVIAIENDTALLHDDSDCWDRVCDLLRCAQTTTEEKMRLLYMFRDAPDDIRSTDNSDKLPAEIREYHDQKERLTATDTKGAC